MQRERLVMAGRHVSQFVIITGPGDQTQGLMKARAQSTTELYSQPLKHFLMIYPSPDVICSLAIPRDRIKTEEVSFPAHSWALHRLGHNKEIAAL